MTTSYHEFVTKVVELFELQSTIATEHEEQ